MVKWECENDALYGMYIRANRMPEILAKAIDMWLTRGAGEQLKDLRAQALRDKIGSLWEG